MDSLPQELIDAITDCLPHPVRSSQGVGDNSATASLRFRRTRTEDQTVLLDANILKDLDGVPSYAHIKSNPSVLGMKAAIFGPSDADIEDLATSVDVCQNLRSLFLSCTIITSTTTPS